MGRKIFAEENIYSYLKSFAKSGPICSTGLILGQSSGSNDFVILAVRTPDQTEKESEPFQVSPAAFESVEKINNVWICDHAKHVTKMLPGGMWVLGIFICSPDNLFSDDSAQLRAKFLLLLLKKSLSHEPMLHGNSPTSDKLLLHINTKNFNFSCKTLDVNNVHSSFNTADWKFQNNYTNWCQIYCTYDPLQPSFGGNMSYPVKDQLKNALIEVDTQLEKAMITLNGQIQNPDETLESLIKKEISKSCEILDPPNLKADIFLPFKKVSEWEELEVDKNSIRVKDCDVEVHLQGVLACHVFISQKSTVAEAISAIKEDLVRSLASRFEMHWDSLVEEEYGSPEEKLCVHEPPRRVSVVLPGSKIMFNDYLFPGEGASEVISSFKEMLDLNISESNLEKEIELERDPLEFYESSMNLPKTLSDEFVESSLPKGYLLFFFSIGVILIAVAIALIMKNQNGARGT